MSSRAGGGQSQTCLAEAERSPEAILSQSGRLQPERLFCSDLACAFSSAVLHGWGGVGGCLQMCKPTQSRG